MRQLAGLGAKHFLVIPAVDLATIPLVVTDNESAAAIQLRRIEAHGLFLTPLDRRRQWYRYHGLFREFLLGELRRTEPDIIMTLHQRAADWYGAKTIGYLAAIVLADRDLGLRLEEFQQLESGQGDPHAHQTVEARP